MSSRLTLNVPDDFDLTRAVCSYGYFILAPNLWDPSRRTLTRPLRGQRDRLLRVRLSQPRRQVVLQTDRRVDRAEAAKLKQQVVRMLRVDEDLSSWHRLSKRAWREGFGRLFRSPTLFEDLVKTITTCNVSWPNTRRMNALLCEHVGRGGFPTPRQVVRAGSATLKAKCKVGYRAERIHDLASQIVTGELRLAELEDPTLDDDALYDRLLSLNGFGPYAAANACQLLGRYDRLPIDSETYRHYCKVKGIARPADVKSLHAEIEAYYARYRPYRFLAYWHELWGHYEQHAQRPSDQWDEAVADAFTASKM